MSEDGFIDRQGREVVNASTIDRAIAKKEQQRQRSVDLERQLADANAANAVLEKRLAELPERLRIELVGLWVDTMPDRRVRDLTVSVKDSLHALLEDRRKEKDNERHV